MLRAYRLLRTQINQRDGRLKLDSAKPLLTSRVGAGSDIPEHKCFVFAPNHQVLHDYGAISCGSKVGDRCDALERRLLNCGCDSS